VFQNNIIGSTLLDAGKQWMMIVINPNNRTYTLAQAQGMFGSAVTGNREVDPLLAAVTDFRLSAGSPALDAGKVLGNGQRFTGAAPDLGAREKP
jgi:hypothetical protein